MGWWPTIHDRCYLVLILLVKSMGQISSQVCCTLLSGRFWMVGDTHGIVGDHDHLLCGIVQSIATNTQYQMFFQLEEVTEGSARKVTSGSE